MFWMLVQQLMKYRSTSTSLNNGKISDGCKPSFFVLCLLGLYPNTIFTGGGEASLLTVVAHGSQSLFLNIYSTRRTCCLTNTLHFFLTKNSLNHVISFLFTMTYEVMLDLIPLDMGGDCE